MGCCGTFLRSGVHTPIARGHRPAMPLVSLHSSVAVSCFALIICVPALPRIYTQNISALGGCATALDGMGDDTLSRLELARGSFLPQAVQPITIMMLCFSQFNHAWHTSSERHQ